MEAVLHNWFRPVQANGRASFRAYKEIMPSPLLRPYVSRYWVSEPASLSKDTSVDDAVDRVVPDGCTDIVLEYDLGDDSRRIGYFGMLDRAFPIDYGQDRTVRKFGVRFFPGGAYPFLRMPLAGFSNRHYPLEQIWPDIAREIKEGILTRPSPEAMARMMDHCLLSILEQNGTAGDSVLANLLYRIFASGGKIGVRELAESETVGTRLMNRKFRQWIGFSPKKFSEIVRFQTVVRDIQNHREPDWGTIAFERGFFDQAHLIREFKRYYGLPPSAAVQEFHRASDLSNTDTD
ncbi:helix-turn-helix domain-containing protein [Paenibacillus sp. P26]|nr:helix-turn-helix domain-containing protein [Paenibacillus sp. P26]